MPRDGHENGDCRFTQPQTTLFYTAFFSAFLRADGDDDRGLLFSFIQRLKLLL